jgi:murein DD-endopeptidase MepM/ murein hydrolase activator NlpD
MLVTLFAAGIGFAFSLILAITPAIPLGHATDESGLYPAPPGYLLPWAGGEIHGVTQGEDTTFTHNGLTAYALDFDLNYETVVAARSGKVVLAREDSNAGGCSSFYANSSNYVVIDHGDGTAGAYLHLAYDSVEVEVGDVLARGEPLAVSGETGVTCSDVDGGPGPHLHFQVQTYVENKYLTQSLPIAFDDIPAKEGVALDGVSYASGNYGPGKPQKIPLTPHRVSRAFNPLAKPLIRDLISDSELEATPPPPPDTPTPTKTPVPLIESYTTFEPEPSETPEPTLTPEPTATEVITPPPPPTATVTQQPPTATAPAATDTPEPPTETPSAEEPTPEPSP